MPLADPTDAVTLCLILTQLSALVPHHPIPLPSLYMLTVSLSSSSPLLSSSWHTEVTLLKHGVNPHILNPSNVLISS